MTLADQVVSSASNVLAVVLVARVLTPDDFGRFSLGYTMLTLTLALSRAYFGTRVTLAPDHETALRLTGGLLAAIALLAPLVVAVVLALSVVAAGTASLGVLVVVACATPVVCMQDIVRFGAVAAGRPRTALVSDSVWLAAMCVPFLMSSSLSPSATLAVWMGAAVVALLVALAGLRRRPRLREGLAELTRRDRISGSVAIGSIVTTAATLLLLLVVTTALNPAAAGSLRGASTAMGPINVLLAFSALSLTPTLVRRGRTGDMRFCASIGLALAVLTLAWGGVLLALPRWAGEAAFGASWPGIRSVLAWTVLQYLFIGVSTGPVLGLKVRGQARRLVSQRVSAAFATVLGGSLVAFAVADVRAVALALALASALSAAVGWTQFSRAVSASTGRESSPQPATTTLSRAEG
ncbi:MAG: hypothetical protein M3P48_04300 [Actinomycetota bacterium]|nr:hypothetical protein [Actinomycetota bacterium]